MDSWVPASAARKTTFKLSVAYPVFTESFIDVTQLVNTAMMSM
jgi:hypothetical protein